MGMPREFETLAGCDIGRAAAQSIPDAVTTVLDFDTETRDPLGMFTVAQPTRLTVPPGMGGTWEFIFHGAWASNATGRRQMILFTNAGVEIGWSFYPSTVAIALGQTVRGTVRLVAGEYVELKVFQNSGGALNLTTTYVRARRVGS